jgi:acyl carrier protein
MNIEDMRKQAAARQRTCGQIKRMIVARLDLPVDPEWITDDQPLFGRGLELDSLDVLELLVAIEAEFDVRLYESQMSIFGSVSTLADYVNPALRGEELTSGDTSSGGVPATTTS